jgi:4-hydroxy-3-methylbut-2-en-1-yl diphosphate reductase
MNVSIDPFAGFCFGVKRAIRIAENELLQSNKLYCLGELVHNEEEIHRLESSGLQILDHEKLEESTGIKILLRAHGEPPSTYKKAHINKTEIIDATCPIVLKFQKKVKIAWDEMNKINGQVVIYGKKNHPEVIGLIGQTENTAIVIEDLNDIDNIDPHRPIRLFVQTTKNNEDYGKFIDLIKEKIDRVELEIHDFKYHNTICGQVSQRIPKLRKFCNDHEVIIFVSGKNSSNGKQLFAVCKDENAESHFVSAENEIINDWFINAETIGITGATSTPFWLMETIASHISKI